MGLVPELGKTLLTGETSHIVNRIGQSNHRFSGVECPGAHRTVDGHHALAMLQEKFQISVIIIMNPVKDPELPGGFLSKGFIGKNTGVQGMIFDDQMQVFVGILGKRFQTLANKIIGITKFRMTGDLAVTVELQREQKKGLPPFNELIIAGQIAFQSVPDFGVAAHIPEVFAKGMHGGVMPIMPVGNRVQNIATMVNHVMQGTYFELAEKRLTIIGYGHPVNNVTIPVRVLGELGMGIDTSPFQGQPEWPQITFFKNVDRNILRFGVGMHRLMHRTLVAKKHDIGDLFALESLLEKFRQHIQAVAEMQGLARKPVDHVSATKLDFQHLMAALDQPVGEQGKKRAGDPLQKQEFLHRTPTT